MRALTHPAIYLLGAVFTVLTTENAVSGWYVDSLKSAPIIEIRGETADTAVARAVGDRYIEDNLDYLLANNEWLIVNFCAYWCGDCNLFKPNFIKASQLPEYKSIRWAVADVDGVRGNENFRTRFSLPGTPTVILFHKGEIAKDTSVTPASSAVLYGHKGDKKYDDIIAFLKSYFRP
jgi:thiol-disulfide isomerase/thioredoxin